MRDLPKKSVLGRTSLPRECLIAISGVLISACGGTPSTCSTAPQPTSQDCEAKGGEQDGGELKENAEPFGVQTAPKTESEGIRIVRDSVRSSTMDTLPVKMDRS